METMLTSYFFLIRWSLASVLFLGSWAVMMGPLVYGQSAPEYDVHIAMLD